MIDTERLQTITARSRQSCADAGFGESTTPLVDAWHVENPRRGAGSTNIDVYAPTYLWVKPEPGYGGSLVSLRLDDVTIRHSPDKMRLMLMAALEWLDAIEDAEAAS